MVVSLGNSSEEAGSPGDKIKIGLISLYNVGTNWVMLEAEHV